MKWCSFVASLAVVFAWMMPAPASAAAGVSVAPSQLSFGSQCLAAQSSAMSVTVSNSGSDPLAVSSVAITGADPGDFSVSGGFPPTVPPGGSFVVRVVFTAQAMGDRSAKLEITSDAPSSPDDVPLSGVGVTKVLEVTPDHLDFGNQRVKTTSDVLQLSLASTGSAAVTVRSFHLTGNADDFVVRSSAPRTLQPNQTASIPVAFKPQQASTRNGVLVILSDACAGKTSVALSGVGTAPKIQVAPSTVAFGLTATGSTSQGLPMVVSNVGHAPLVISNIELQGSQAADFRLDGLPDVPKVLAPGEEFPMNALFAPTAPGVSTATLRISSDDPNNPSFTVSMSGNVATAGSSAPSASDTTDVTTATPTDSVAAVSVGNHAKGSGAADWFAIAIVCVIVGGVFTTLFAIRRRRELI